jgi:glutathione S-transferase
MSGAGLKLYYDLMSQPSRAVYMFLKLTKVPFVSKPVALRRGEHLGEEYGKINPFHLVPAIDDNGFKLTESVAILKYLSDKYQVPDHWYPKDLQRRARVDCFMAWQHLNLRLYGAMVFRTKVIEPRMTNTPVDTAKLAKFQTDLETTLDKIEHTFLSDQLYLCGEDVSLGDLLGICELMQPVAVGHDVFRSRPKLEAWANRVKERLGPVFDEAHMQLYKVRDMFAGSSPKL